MSDPGRKTISQLRSATLAGAMAARVHAQIDELTKKDAANGKSYWELKLRDDGDVLTLRAWSETDSYRACSQFSKGEAVEISGDFYQNGSFGLDARRWEARPLEEAEAAALFEGSEGAREVNQRDYETVVTLINSVTDPRLKTLCETFLAEYEARFRRAAAARHNHHAYRGGLLRHVSQMMIGADAICGVYPWLNRDLMLTGVLFHDCGKLWEMCPPEAGFEMPRELRGELLGHISIGIELVNALWRKLPLADWRELEPASETVRLHLLHLIAAHHGELQFGSPIEPKTPEAAALHYVDNLDARMEMFSAAYAKQPEIAPGIHERVRALNTSPIKSLPRFVLAEEEIADEN